jgi:serine/threonine-protein kinase
MRRSHVHFGRPRESRGTTSRESVSAPDHGLLTPAPAPGDVIGIYRVERLRSETPDATLYEAAHLGLGCGLPVVIKVYRTTDPRAVESLRAAVRRIGRFGGPHVVRLFDVGVLPPQQPYIVMDFLDGQSMGEHLAKKGPMPIAAAASVLVQACHGLEEPHRHSIIHGDLKPEALVVRSRSDGTVHASMLGFDRPGRCSPGYASPEQLGARADVDARTDVWALGILLYEMITGARAFPSRTLEEMRLTALSRSLPTMTSPGGRVPDELQSIVRQCTAIHRTSRFKSVHELARALAPFVSERPQARRPIVPTLASREEAMVLRPPIIERDEHAAPTVPAPEKTSDRASTVALPPMAPVATVAMVRPIVAATQPMMPPLRPTSPPPRCSSPVPSDAPTALDVSLSPEVLPPRHWALAAAAALVVALALISASAFRRANFAASAAAAAAPPPAEPSVPSAASMRSRR